MKVIELARLAAWTALATCAVASGPVLAQKTTEPAAVPVFFLFPAPLLAGLLCLVVVWLGSVFSWPGVSRLLLLLLLLGHLVRFHHSHLHFHLHLPI